MVTYYAACSLDGYIARLDGSIDWLQGYRGEYSGPGAEPQAGTFDRFLGRIGAVAMGSATYEFILREATSGWPYAERPGWIFSTRELPAIDAADLRFVSGSPELLRDELLASAGDRDLWVVGGGALACDFEAAGILDQVVMTVVPVVLGSGVPFLPRPLTRPLRLAGVVPYDSGMVELRYELSA